MNNLIIPLIFVAILLGCNTVQNKTNDTVKTLNTDTSSITPNTKTVKYSLQEVAKHSNSESCWLAIHKKVYDVTEFIPMHPGGQAILEGCGTDASDLYETRPMGSGTPHSAKARERLDNYYIGDLE